MHDQSKLSELWPRPNGVLHRQGLDRLLPAYDDGAVFGLVAAEPAQGS